MAIDDGLVAGLRAIGFRSAPAVTDALLDQATSHRHSPVQTCEKLVLMEPTERDARNSHAPGPPLWDLQSTGPL